MKKQNAVPLYTETVSVRVSVAEARALCALAAAGRRTLSQTVRLLLESVLNAPEPLGPAPRSRHSSLP